MAEREEGKHFQIKTGNSKNSRNIKNKREEKGCRQNNLQDDRAASMRWNLLEEELDPSADLRQVHRSLARL